MQLLLRIQLSKKHMRSFNGYFEGAIHQIFQFFKFMNRQDFHFDFDATLE